MINPYLCQGIFILSNQCPFSCDYCYNQWCQKSEKPITFDYIKKGIDFLMSNIEKNENPTPGICFLGGEPLVHFKELIVPAIEYINQNYSQIKVLKTLTTNAYYLDLETVKICSDLGIKVNISFDGPRQIQNAHRKKKDQSLTFETVLKHTQYAISYEILQAINSVYCPDTIDYLEESYFFFKNIGVPLWMPNPLINYNWTQYQKEILAEQIENICQDYFSTNTPDMKVGPLYLKENKSYNTLLFYSNGDVSYNFPTYFVPPKEYPYLQRLGKIYNDPIFNKEWVSTFQSVLSDRLNDKWFGNMPKVICNSCPLREDCITPDKTDNKILQEICKNQDPMECYQRRLFKIYEQKYKA